ncbi:MAG: DUF6465 family protein [Eubacteriales bacterium]|nr:DUF6465 family protein [Eubacteriales bacterium]
MAKQSEPLGNLRGSWAEGVDKIKDTAKDLGEKAKEAKDDAVKMAKEVKNDTAKKAKALTKTGKNVVAKTRAKAEKAGEEVAADVKEEVKKAEAVVEKLEKPVKAPRAKKAPKAPKQASVARNLKTKLVFQFDGKDVDADAVMKKAEKAAQKVCKDKQVKSLEVYVNGHENAAYYVVNGEGGDDYRIEL